MMKRKQGNLIELAQNGQFDVIVHGCNCWCEMGAGIAKAIRQAFPEAYQADQQTEPGDRSKLGTCTEAVIEQDGHRLVVVNAYTQFNYRPEAGKVLVDYEAVRSCMRWIGNRHAGLRIGLPKIGAGLAGGDWTCISQIIETELGGEDLTLVEL
jgi:O-acetyl-ADP-ribose deacetylase (regulator of RNase III)